jgi:hypothetical protein
MSGNSSLPGWVSSRACRKPQTQNNLGMLQGGQYQDNYNLQNYLNPMQMTQAYSNIVRGNQGGDVSTPYYTNNAGNYTALAQGVGDLGQKAYDWWNSSNTSQNPGYTYASTGGAQPGVIYGH